MLKKILIFITKLIKKSLEDNILSLSAQLSYYLILSIFPFLILAISFFCGYKTYIYTTLESVAGLLPTQVYEIIYGVVNYAVNSCSKEYLTVSMLVILWSATSGSATIIKAINSAYGFNIKKSFFLIRLRGIIFTLILMLSLQVIFALIIAGRSFLIFVKNISIFPGNNLLYIDILRYTITLFLVALVLTAAYKFLPYERVKFSYVFPGVTFTSLGFMTGSYIYSIYVSSKVIYIKSIYGNLSGLFVFIIWIYIMSIIFLLGAEINSIWGKVS